MSHATPSEAEVVNTLSHLKLSTKTPQKPAAKPKSAPVADSWDEDDDASSGSATETEETDTTSLSRASTATSVSAKSPLSPITTGSEDGNWPNPPPPTPASPTPFDFPDHNGSAAYGAGVVRGGSGDASPARRPEKTTAVAGRLIAGALGVRAPRRTDEEREFDRVVREKERKRRDEERNREKSEKQAAEERKRAIWED